jgi:hypothetical protein
LESLKGKDHSEVLNADGRIILKWIFREMRLQSVDWIHLPQDRNQWRILDGCDQEYETNTSKVINSITA